MPDGNSRAVLAFTGAAELDEVVVVVVDRDAMSYPSAAQCFHSKLSYTYGRLAFFGFRYW